MKDYYTKIVIRRFYDFCCFKDFKFLNFIVIYFFLIRIYVIKNYFCRCKS
jgi:hypothetical protein